MSLETHSAEDQLPEAAKPPLPTRETIADGVLLLREQPSWLPKADKYRLYLAIEELIHAGYTVNEVLGAIGLTRALYYDRLWFTDEQAAEMAATIVPPVSSQEPEDKKEKKERSAREILDLIDEVNRLRYEKNIFIDEACKKAGITKRQYYFWETNRHDLIKKCNTPEAYDEELPQKREKRGSNGTVRIKKERAPAGLRGRPPKAEFIEISTEDLEVRKRIIAEVRAKIQKGMAYNTALHTSNIRAKTYHAWMRQIEKAENKNNLETLNPDALYDEYREGKISKEIFTNRLINRYTQFIRWKAAEYAMRTMSPYGEQVDEQELISHAIYDGIVLNMDNFKPDVGVPFSSFISQKICQRMIDSMRQQDRFSRNERNDSRVTWHDEESFYTDNGRYPYSDAELAEYLQKKLPGIDISVSDISKKIVRLPSLISIDAVRVMGHEGRETSLHHVLGKKDPSLSHTDDEMLIDYVLSKCTAAQKKILISHYLEGKTFKQIGIEEGFSESRESQLHSQLIDDIRQKLLGDVHLRGLFKHERETESASAS